LIKISKKIKLELFNLLNKEKNIFGEEYQPNGILEFLSEIWDLRAMPSSDERFDDAYGDIVQHIVNNSDWDYDFLFLERLKLLADDIHFIKFIETIVNPRFRKNENEILKLIFLINPYFGKSTQIDPLIPA